MTECRCTQTTLPGVSVIERLNANALVAAEREGMMILVASKFQLTDFVVMGIILIGMIGYPIDMRCDGLKVSSFLGAAGDEETALSRERKVNNVPVSCLLSLATATN